MRIAITTDWLVTPGGAERVIAEFHTLWPEAPIFTTVRRAELFPDADVRTSSLQCRYRLLGRHRLLLPAMPRAVESWDLRGFDVIVSSSHAVAKGCLPPPTARHICYCHTPMRYAWEMEERYLDDFGLLGPLRSIVKTQFRKLRLWDCTTARRVDLFIANSRSTQERIRRIYGRESIVLHPPVQDHFFLSREATSDGPQAPRYFLAVGRLVPYKRFDLLITVANAERLPLRIAGTGPDARRLRRMAGPTVEFFGFVPESELPALYAGAKAFLFPTHEDAGIAPLEAQASGTPVIALGKGGVLDTVRDGETGILFPEQTEESLRAALTRFTVTDWDRAHIRNHAARFSSARFREALQRIIEDACITPAHSAQSIPGPPASPPS